NASWLSDLRTPGIPQDEALEDLREIIKRGLAGALTRYLPPDDPHFEWLVEESAQDTLLKVLDKLDTFEGRSQFTTWVYRIAVRSALTELRRKRWQNVSLDEMSETFEGDNLFPSPEPRTEDQIQRHQMIERVRDIIEHELTEKQRAALIALSGGMAMDQVASELSTNRNALYKLMHDARKRLKKRLADEGLNVDEILAAFMD
ncbi:MAG: sigma-70 family RNA polymerase sigma factor, partial [Anaerolineaceae bacterium]